MVKNKISKFKFLFKTRLEKLRKWLRENRKKIVYKDFVKSVVIFLIFYIILTSITFTFMIVQLQYSYSVTIWLSTILGSIFTIAFTFKINFRCIVLLVLPQLFSKKGRTALIGYAFFIALTGPGVNTTKNTEVLTTSLSCGQDQLQSAVKEIIEIMKQPFIAIKNVVKHIIKVIEKVLVKVKKVLIKIKNLIVNILNVIKSAFSWLGNIVNICNKEIGTPFDRCINAFESAVTDCENKLGVMSFLCNIATAVKMVCYSVKFLDVICMLLSFLNDAIIGTVKRKLDKFIQDIHDMFYVSVHFDHSFEFKTKSSKNMSQISSDMVSEIEHRSKNILFFFNVFTIISGIFFLWVILKAMHYKHKFLVNDRFDNYFLTKFFFDVEEQRQKLNMETLLPLGRRERRKYIKINSITLVFREKLKIIRSAVFLVVSTIQLGSFMLTDYGLFWILDTIRKYGSQEKGIDMPPMITLNVEGKGMGAEMYEGMVEAFDPMTEEYSLDPVPCLPKPYEPDYDEYVEIVVISILCWILLFFEPYGLRLRQAVMNKCFPSRAKERAIWLYNNILRKRSSFLKIARRQLRRKFVKDKAGVKEESFGFLDYIRAKFGQYRCIRWIFGKGHNEFCMLCGIGFSGKDDVVRCVRPGCPVKYCGTCYEELQNQCSICMEPFEYGDMSDISDEKDSSDEDKDKFCRERTKYERKRNLRKQNIFTSDIDIEAGSLKEEYILKIFKVLKEK